MDYLVFTLIFIATIGSACIVAFSRNLIYSAFALMGTFLGVAGTFVFLNADFLGLAQVMVYAGGILILTIFAVMLTSKIESSHQTNPVLNFKAIVPLMMILILLLGKVVTTDMWVVQSEVTHNPTITEIGNGLLTNYLLPFELISVLLLMSMMGAAIMTRRHVKE